MCSTGVCKFSRDHSTCVYFIPWEGHRASFQNPLGKATGLLFRPQKDPSGAFGPKKTPLGLLAPQRPLWGCGPNKMGTGGASFPKKDPSGDVGPKKTPLGLLASKPNQTKWADPMQSRHPQAYVLVFIEGCLVLYRKVHVHHDGTELFLF